MSSLMVFSRPSNTALRDVQQFGQPERGDVVDINDDDLFHWGDDVMGPAALGWWQVIVVPNTKISDLAYLIKGSVRPREMGFYSWRHRVWRLDLDALAVGQLPGGIWIAPMDRLRAAAATKAQTLVHIEIGNAPLVIG